MLTELRDGQGTYANRTGLSVCLDCPAGFACGLAVAEPSPCPVGYYCPLRTGASPPPCPLGAFGNASALSAVSQCYLCTPGTFCSRAGLTQPDGVCQQVCVRAAPLSCQRPHEFMRWVVVALSVGLLLSVGFVQRLRCDECDRHLRHAAKPHLSTGHPLPPLSLSALAVCLSVPTLCPAHVNLFVVASLQGYYCPTQSQQPTPCPIGTFSGASGNRALSDCLQCTPGSYCNASALLAPVGLCTAGYYCSGVTPAFERLFCISLLQTHVMERCCALCLDAWSMCVCVCLCSGCFDGRAKQHRIGRRSVSRWLLLPDGFCGACGLQRRLISGQQRSVEL